MVLGIVQFFNMRCVVLSGVDHGRDAGRHRCYKPMRDTWLRVSYCGAHGRSMLLQQVFMHRNVSYQMYTVCLDTSMSPWHAHVGHAGTATGHIIAISSLHSKNTIYAYTQHDGHCTWAMPCHSAWPHGHRPHPQAIMHTIHVAILCTFTNAWCSNMRAFVPTMLKAVGHACFVSVHQAG